MKNAMIYTSVLVVLASIAFGTICQGGTCPGCGGADCQAPCLYEVTPAAAGGGWIPVGDMLDCPQGCHCWDHVGIGGQGQPYFDPASGKYYEGWCYEDHVPDPDVPEFTLIGAGIAVAGGIGYAAFRRYRR